MNIHFSQIAITAVSKANGEATAKTTHVFYINLNTATYIPKVIRSAAALESEAENEEIDKLRKKHRLEPSDLRMQKRKLIG